MFEIVKSYVREHTAELAIYGVMTGLIATIAVLATGDFSQVAEAGRRR